MNAECNMVTIETSDLYYAAFLRARGAEIAGISWNRAGRCTWSIEVHGCTDSQEPYLAFLRNETVGAKSYAESVIELKRSAMNPR